MRILSALCSNRIVRLLHNAAKHGKKMLALIRHEGHEFAAFVSGSEESLLPQIGRERIVEIDFERVIEWKEIPGFLDEMSGIQSCALRSNAVKICGRVHNIIDVGEGKSVIDIYIQNGPEFLSVTSEELENKVPTLGSGLEITVENLCFEVR
jgi:hypothetical protein